MRRAFTLQLVLPPQPVRSLDVPCPAPGRRGKHEVYTYANDPSPGITRQVCVACGAKASYGRLAT